MKIKDQPKVKALAWYLRFLSEDLENMSELDLGKLAVEARFYFENPNKGLLAYWTARMHSRSIASLKKKGMDTNDLEVHPKGQGTERADYDIPTIPMGIFRSDYPWRENLKLVQAELGRFLEEEIHRRPCAFKPQGTAQICFGRDEEKFRVIYNPDEPAFTDNLDPSKLGEKAKLSLIFALDAIPCESAIKTCRECGKYFLHLSKKPKFFCDYKCTVKFTSRKRREKDPEGYRARQREIMRRKYKEQKAQKLGRRVEKRMFQRKSISKSGRRKEG